jgi:hypothetical protein
VKKIHFIENPKKQSPDEVVAGLLHVPGDADVLGALLLRV